MIDQVTEMLHKVDSDTMGRLIAYVGGSSIAAASQVSTVVQTASVADWALWIGSVCVLGRLVFDVVKWVVERKDKK